MFIQRTIRRLIATKPQFIEAEWRKYASITGSDNGLSPGRRQAIIWTSAGILPIGPPGTNFNEILIGIHIFSFKKMHLKMSSAKWRYFCLGLMQCVNPVQCILCSWILMANIACVSNQQGNKNDVKWKSQSPFWKIENSMSPSAMS